MQEARERERARELQEEAEHQEFLREQVVAKYGNTLEVEVRDRYGTRIESAKGTKAHKPLTQFAMQNKAKGKKKEVGVETFPRHD